MNPVRRDRLSAGLMRAIAACGSGEAPIEELEVCPWASATFVGAVHRFAVDLSSADAALLALRLEAHEFALPGHVVADISATQQPQAGGAVRVEIEVLTVEE